ncbi:MAG: two-component sensor histidine kinase, partial [Gammaproteobacteria bacterium]|nr:two-component sensor histidine kinase [Gammaproteobacteria bacterium]MBU1468610.1 two-component sensor histidine kinase [Gammaproteobacteria bacterium]
MACCYIVMEFTQIRFGASRAEQLLCVDAEISSVLLLSGIQKDLPDSQFSWTSQSSKPFSIAALSSLIAEKKWLKLPNNSYQIAFGKTNQPVLIGHANQDRPLFKIESLLAQFLLANDISYSDKVTLLKSMSCLSMKEISSKVSSPLTAVALVSGAYSEYGFVWKDKDTSNTVYLSVVHDDNVSLTLIVVIVVGVGIAIMLMLIWRELISLDFKRKTFESITRQIARGRSGLPKGIPDSSGTLKELAYSFDSMSSHIQRLLKVQREMINAISHELRTPIARLRFGLEVMK